MLRFEDGVPPAEAMQILADISEEEFYKGISSAGLSTTREQLFYKIIKREVESGFYKWVDCSRYALKLLMPENSAAYDCGNHLYSSSELYEFDPVKNGANMIKHGLGFSEVVSYSSKFGTLTVPCPDQNDGKRYVIFSDLDAGEGGKNLSFPFANMKGKIYTLSIAQNLSGRYRFISSRRMSSKRHAEDMMKSFKNIYERNSLAKKDLVDRCVAIVEQHLFR